MTTATTTKPVTAYEDEIEKLKKELEKHEHESAKHQKLVVFAWSGDLDKIWPTFILATTAAAMGMQTTVFFTF